MITLDPESPDYVQRAEQDRLAPPRMSHPMSYWTKRHIIEEATKYDNRAPEALGRIGLEDLRFLLLQYEGTYLTGSATEAGGMRHTRYYMVDVPR